MLLCDIDFEGGERKIFAIVLTSLGGGQVREIEEGGRQHCVQDG